jgi:MoxR-like ATPase
MKTAIIRAALFTPFSKGRWGLPICVEDEPGTAKSAAIVEVAEELGMPYEILSPGERGEAAFGVVPVPVSDTEGYALTLSTVIAEALKEGRSVADSLDLALRAAGRKPATRLCYPRPDWTDKFIGSGGEDLGGVIFVDEVTTAPPMIQAALLGLVLERRIGSHTFGPRVRVVGAYNPPELAAGGFDLSAPLANRTGHIRWGAPTVEEHAAYMLRGDTGSAERSGVRADLAVAEEKRVLGLWPEAFASARGLEVAFLTRRPNLKNVCPKAGDPKVGRSWPSDRTWEMATRALASADVHDLSDVETEAFVAAFIGEAASSEFFAFKQDQDLPNPADLLDGKEHFSHSSKRPDRTAAVLNACAALVTPMGSTKRSERADALWSLIEKEAKGKADLDLFVPCVFALIDANLHARKSATMAMSAVQPILRHAKITPGKR